MALDKFILKHTPKACLLGIFYWWAFSNGASKVPEKVYMPVEVPVLTSRTDDLLEYIGKNVPKGYYEAVKTVSANMPLPPVHRKKKGK